MELFNLSIQNTSKSSFIFSASAPQFSITTRNRKCIYRVRISKLHQTDSISLSSYAYGPISCRVSAHFGRKAARRNSLRKKLLDDPEVRRNPSSLIPIPHLENLESNCDRIEEFQGTSSGGRAKEDDLGASDSFAAESASDINLSAEISGASDRLARLESWMLQYNKDAEFWGIGSGHIFLVLQDLEGNVKQVVVNEDEILKRSKVYGLDCDDLTEANSKILYAKKIAREMEHGDNVIPSNSSVAKFSVVNEETSFVTAIRAAVSSPELSPKLTRIGAFLFGGVMALLVVNKLFSSGTKEKEYTQLEKEMLGRKIKSRKEKEAVKKGSVEVIQEAAESPIIVFQKPMLDKEELMNNILSAKAEKNKLTLLDSSISNTRKSYSIAEKIEEIRLMVQEARGIEGRKQSVISKDVEGKALFDKDQEIGESQVEDVSAMSHSVGCPHKDGDYKSTLTLAPSGALVEHNVTQTGCEPSESVCSQTSIAACIDVSRDCQNKEHDRKEIESSLSLMARDQVCQSSKTPCTESHVSSNTSSSGKPRVILSVQEAREFLSKKSSINKVKREQMVPAGEIRPDSSVFTDSEENVVTEQTLHVETIEDKTCTSAVASKSTDAKDDSVDVASIGKVPTFLEENDPVKCTYAEQSCQDFVPGKDSFEKNAAGDRERSPCIEEKSPATCIEEKSPATINPTNIGNGKEIGSMLEIENWLENNFHEVEPLLRKMGEGFSKNYMLARIKAGGDSTVSEQRELGFDDGASEFEWMEDNRLKKIVFKVRENELSGRDPFHLMDADDKLAFFQGLEKKVERENEKLSHLHTWLHTNIENLDYGADGISLYDPPEKIMPRWKEPASVRIPEFLNSFCEQRKAIFPGDTDTSFLERKSEQEILQKSRESVANPSDINRNAKSNSTKKAKTVIEGSDGSVRPGKKSGKEFWQHTKKWSREFLECYNSETDPEVKSVMKDIGRDLDRWITEKEIEEAGELLTKLREKNKQYVEKKVNKLKRELELFGPQAVVSKYREYVEEKEEDYLWWLDLPHILCIELYTVENGENRIGFYTLEMASDLELEPKPHHVIAFEGAGDCKKLCYIIQAHLEMFGSGQAFVIPRPPKDAFREAKANGFNVTVIQKGELQLNVDQTLEEVEKMICEIGSKVYHDMILRERSLDISSVMKGLGVDRKPWRRRKLRKKLNRSTEK